MRASGIAKIETAFLPGGTASVKHCQKTNGAKRLLAASGVGGVVGIQKPMTSPEVELMRKRILAVYQRDVFSGEVRLRPGQTHPKFHGPDAIGFTKLELHPGAKSKSVKQIRFVTAVELEIAEDFLAHGWIEPCVATGWPSNGFRVPENEKG